MIDPDRHAENRNIVESILRYVPGFRGYLEKEYRRESDYLARTWLADRLQRSKQGLDRCMQAQVDAGQLDALPQFERLRGRLDRFISQLRGAVRGYSGLFDFVRVKEDLLDQVYQNDMSLINDVERLAGSIEQLGGKLEDSTASLNAIMQQLDEVHRKYERRGELLGGLGS